MLHHIGLPVEFTQLFSFGYQRAHACAGEEGRDARTTSAQLFGERALGREVELQFTGQILALELFVFAHVAGNHLGNLPRFQQLAQAKTVNTCVVRNDREVLDMGVAQSGDQGLGDAAQTKTAHGHQLAVFDDVGQRCGGAGEDLFHVITLH